MAFIKIKEITPEGDQSGVAKSSTLPETAVICKAPLKLAALISEVMPGRSVHYVSKGDWSMHDLVMQLLSKYSPAELFITTYALRETPIRQLILAQQKGLITSLQLLIDYRAKIRTPEVYHLVNMNANKIAMLAIHAKVCVIRTAEHCISIVTSSNWTRNPKVEAGVITMDPSIGEFHIEWIEKLLENAEIFK